MNKIQSMRLDEITEYGALEELRLEWSMLLERCPNATPFQSPEWLLVRGSRIYSYLSGFQPELARFSPEALLIGHAVEGAIREGIREFDFLRGGEGYKYLWGARDRSNHRLWLRHAGSMAEAAARVGR